MIIMQVSVRYGGTVNLGNFENAKVEIEHTATLEPDDVLSDVYAKLWEMSRVEAQREARAVKERRVQSPPTEADNEPATDPAKNNQATNQNGFRAKTLNDMVTPKQLWMIRSLCREMGEDADEMWEKFSDNTCGLEEMSKRAASGFIDHLKKKAAQ